jgi:hypothetical protein
MKIKNKKNWKFYSGKMLKEILNLDQVSYSKVNKLLIPENFNMIY